MADKIYDLPLDWPELDAWCREYPITVGVDLASGDDTTWVGMRSRGESVEWYQLTKSEAVNLYDRKAKRMSGDVELMVADIDRFEITPATRCEIFKRRFGQWVEDQFLGAMILEHYGKL